MPGGPPAAGGGKAPARRTRAPNRAQDLFDRPLAPLPVDADARQCVRTRRYTRSGSHLTNLQQRDMGGMLSTGRSRLAGGGVLVLAALVAVVLRSRAQRLKAKKDAELLASRTSTAEIQGDYRKSEDYRRRNAQGR